MTDGGSEEGIRIHSYTLNRILPPHHVLVTHSHTGVRNEREREGETDQASGERRYDKREVFQRAYSESRSMVAAAMRHAAAVVVVAVVIVVVVGHPTS